MALTIKEQLDIISGVVTPNDSTYTLDDLVNQVAVNHSETLLTGFKDVDSTTNPLAARYVSKLVDISQLLVRNSRKGQIPNVILGNLVPIILMKSLRLLTMFSSS